MFGSAKLTKNADPYKYKYSDYGVSFDFSSECSFTDGGMGRNGADMSSSAHVDNKNNKNKDISILEEGPR